MVPGTVVLRVLHSRDRKPDLTFWEGGDSADTPTGRLPFRPPVLLRGTGQGWQGCLREVHFAVPLAAPKVLARLRGLGNLGGFPREMEGR